MARRGEMVESARLLERGASILRPLPPQNGEELRSAYAALAEYYRAKKEPAEEAHYRKLAAKR
jgi:hypothetical protein